MAIRTAIFRLVPVDGNGKIVNKDKATIAQVTRSSSDHRIFEFQSGSAPNAAKSNSETAPTIHDYLVAEDSDGFAVVYIDQTYIITKQ